MYAVGYFLEVGIGTEPNWKECVFPLTFLVSPCFLLLLHTRTLGYFGFISALCHAMPARGAVAVAHEALPDITHFYS